MNKKRILITGAGSGFGLCGSVHNRLLAGISVWCVIMGEHGCRYSSDGRFRFRLPKCCCDACRYIYRRFAVFCCYRCFLTHGRNQSCGSK